MNDSSGTPPADKIARALMYAGAAVATLSVAAWGLSFFPAIPEWMVRLAIFKLTLASAAGLMIAGAAIRRSLRPGRGGAQQLGDGAAPPAVPTHVDRVNARHEDR